MTKDNTMPGDGTDDGRRGELESLKDELRSFKDTIVDGLIVIGENKKVLSFNPGAERIFGYAAAEVIGRNVKMLMPEPYHAEHDQYVDNYRRSGAPKIIGVGREVRGCRKDGSTFPMYLSVGEMHSGGSRQFVGVIHDLSDFRDRQDLVEGITSNLPGPVFRRVHRADGTFWYSYVSEGLRIAFDLDPDTVMSGADHLVNAIHEDDRDAWFAAVREANEKMVPYDYEMRLIGDNGTTKWMRAIAHPHRAENGDTIWDGLALDITMQKQAEASRTESLRQFQNVLDAAPDAIWIAADAEIVYANDAAAQMLGVEEPSELVGHNNLGLISPDDLGEVNRRKVLLHREERVPPVEIKRQRVDGETIDTETSSIGISWDGRPADLIIARDVTDRKKAEAQLRQAQKMDAIGQLTGGVAHDFNNLLAVLMMDLEQLSAIRAGDAESEALILEARGVAKSAADLTARLLAFSRQQDLKPEVCDVRETVSGSISLLHRTIGEHIELDEITSALLWPVMVDPQQLENALLNLAVNARDAMPRGGRITIKANNIVLDANYTDDIDGLQAGEYVQISVTDTGTGIPREIQDRVFEPFFTTKDVGAGTGLGLSMVYGFAKQSGGHAAINSEAGHGTTISLYLPRALPANATAERKDPASNIEGSGDETILMAEDFPQLRKRGAQILTKLGYRVIEAENGKAALAALEAAGPIDLLFTDMVMPGGMNGLELANEARAYQPSIKILYTSGYAEGAEFNLEAADSDSIRLQKPYSRQDLAQTIRNVLDGN